MKIEDYDELYRAQGGLCAICGKSEIAMIWASRGRTKVSHLAVDHDHKTGAIRGLLCYRCNIGLGSFRDDPALLRQAARYLTQRRDPAMAVFAADAEAQEVSVADYLRAYGILPVAL